MATILESINSTFVPPRTRRIGNFIEGILIENCLSNSLCYGLNFTVIPKGIENSYGALNKSMLKTSWTSKKKETVDTINYFRKEPDLVVLPPSGEPMMIEVKSRSLHSLETHLRSHYFLKELNDIFSLYPITRVVYVDIQRRKICSISGIEPIDIESQLKNWEQPWSWIEGLDSKESYKRWSDSFLFDPLHQAVIKLTNKSTKIVEEEIA